jgi:hypothetical protein
MSVVLMSKRELNRIDILARLDGGRLTTAAAADLMRLTQRQTHRLLKRYRDGGAAAIANRRRGRPSNNRLSDVVRDYAIALVRESVDRVSIDSRITGSASDFGRSAFGDLALAGGYPFRRLGRSAGIQHHRQPQGRESGNGVQRSAVTGSTDAFGDPSKPTKRSPSIWRLSSAAAIRLMKLISDLPRMIPDPAKARTATGQDRTKSPPDTVAT